MPEVEYLQHKICQKGLRVQGTYVPWADAPEPKGVAELRSWVGELLWKVLAQPSHHCSTPVQPAEGEFWT